MLGQRFTDTFKRFNINVDGSLIQKEYSDLLKNNFYVLPDTISLLNNLKSTDTTIIAGTNGVKNIQNNRLTHSGLNDYFDDIFISEEVGFNKPDKRFFSAIKNKYPQIKFENTVVIGDRLESDIQGAVNSNLKSIWFNKNKLINHYDYQPTYETDSLLTIPDIISELSD